MRSDKWPVAGTCPWTLRRFGAVLGCFEQYPRLAEVSSNRLWPEMRVRTGAHPQHDFAATACISSDVAPICNAVIAVEPWSVHDEPQKGITNKSTIYYRGGKLFNTILGVPFELQVEYNGPQNPIPTIKAPILESNLLGRTMPTSCSSRASAVSSGFQHRTGPTQIIIGASIITNTVLVAPYYTYSIS